MRWWKSDVPWAFGAGWFAASVFIVAYATYEQYKCDQRQRQQQQQDRVFRPQSYRDEGFHEMSEDE
jgi:uncharacterized membrane protein YebE (DUF533 family)